MFMKYTQQQQQKKRKWFFFFQENNLFKFVVGKLMRWQHFVVAAICWWTLSRSGYFLLSYLHTSAKRVRIAWKSVYFDIFIFINHFNFVYIFSLSASMPLYYKKLQGKRHNFSTDNNSRYEITAECPVSICLHIRPLISQTNSTHFYSQTQIICCRCKLTAKV